MFAASLDLLVWTSACRYSGEEAGLFGSQDIAKNYKTAGKMVNAMMQLDMTT